MATVFGEQMIPEFGETVTVSETVCTGILSSQSAIEGITPPYVITDNTAFLRVLKSALSVAPVSGETTVTARGVDWLVTNVDDGEGGIWRLTLERSALSEFAGKGRRDD